MRKFITALAFLLMLFACTAFASSANAEHSHPVCGGDSCADSSHSQSHSDIISRTAWNP